MRECVCVAGTCTDLNWEVEGWGSWKAWATSQNGYSVELEACVNEQAVQVLGPSDKGMVYNVRDNSRGKMILRLRDADGVAVLEGAETIAAQVEVGGETWSECWKASVRPMPQPLRMLVNLFHRSGAKTS